MGFKSSGFGPRPSDPAQVELVQAIPDSQPALDRRQAVRPNALQNYLYLEPSTTSSHEFAPTRGESTGSFQRRPAVVGRWVPGGHSATSPGTGIEGSAAETTWTPSLTGKIHIITWHRARLTSPCLALRLRHGSF